jgi:hypothetical protein
MAMHSCGALPQTLITIMERLIVCQGTAQLVTAVAALHQHEAANGGQGKGRRSRDHLLICGLAVAQSQTSAFAGVVEQMAGLLHPFASITRLSDVQLEGLLAEASRASVATDIAALLQQVVGIGNVDEVFTVRDWQPCNILALGAFPAARHICYGDGVGVYLPRGFMAGKPTVWSWSKNLLRRAISSSSPLLANPRLDISYLLLPGAFGMPPSGKVVRTNVAQLRDLFGRLNPLLDVTTLNDLRNRTASRPLWVLIGSNFSEQGMMTQRAEFSAYRAWIEGLRPQPGTVLLMKSHPRDRTGKRELLEQHLQGLFSEILSADYISSAYLPMETLLLDLMPVVGNLQSLTFSTACLGTHFVVGCTTHIGFGDALVRKYIVANRRHERCVHESELRRLCAV